MADNISQRDIDEFDDWDNFEDYFPEDDTVVLEESEYEA